MPRPVAGHDGDYNIMHWVFLLCFLSQPGVAVHSLAGVRDCFFPPRESKGEDAKWRCGQKEACEQKGGEAAAQW